MSYYHRPASSAYGNLFALAVLAVFLLVVANGTSRAWAASSAFSPLTWSPANVQYSVYTISESDAANSLTSELLITLPDNEDYEIRCGSPIRRAVRILGGRNIKWVGAEIILNNKRFASSSVRRRALMIQDGPAAVDGRIVHIEGHLWHGNDISEGLNTCCGKAIVQIANCRAHEIRFRSCDDRDGTNEYSGISANHPDGIQTWGSCKELRIDGLTVTSGYQGLFLNEDTSLVTPQSPDLLLRRYNWAGIQTESTQEGPANVSYEATALVADFEGDTESWTNWNSGTSLTHSGSQAYTGSSSLAVTRTFGTGFDQAGIRSASLPPGALTGNTISAWVYIPADAPGNGWSARLGIYQADNTQVFASNYSSLDTGQWTQIKFDYSDYVAEDIPGTDISRAIVQVSRSSGAASEAITFHVDAVQIGSTTVEFTGPTTVYAGHRALTLAQNWGNLLIDNGTVWARHHPSAGWIWNSPNPSPATDFWRTRYWDGTSYVSEPPTTTAGFIDCLYPRPTATGSDSLGQYATWNQASEPRIKDWSNVSGQARVYSGVPPNGDYVPFESTGLDYSSPGYGLSTTDADHFWLAVY